MVKVLNRFIISIDPVKLIGLSSLRRVTMTISHLSSELMKAIKYIEYDSSFGDKEKQQAEELKVTCNLNDAACKLKSRTTNRQRSCAQRLGYEIFYSS
ncbi:peptidylprolyl isomerase [Trifolium repens]|nr:peptidylprolyl isomerase [Trifolium repens]